MPRPIPVSLRCGSLFRVLFPIASLAICTVPSLRAQGTGWTYAAGGDGGYKIHDVVDASGWSIITGGSFSATTILGMSSLEGSSFFIGTNTGATAANRGFSRFFAGRTVQPGTYTVTAYIGYPNDGTRSFTTNLEMKLLADSNGDGVYAYAERITTGVAAVYNPTPVSLGWEKWTFTFSVDASTASSNGTGAVGKTLGFMILSSVAQNKGFVVDSLDLAYTPWSWAPVGPGGGGRYTGSALSPHDANLILCGSDMGGWYRSTNNGSTWATYPQLEIRQPRNPRPWIFHPTDKSLVFGCSTYGFFVSENAGVGWLPIDGPWNTTDGSGVLLRRGPRAVAFDPASPDTGIAAFPVTSDVAYSRLYRTTDRGATWTPVASLPSTGGSPLNVRFIPGAIVVVTDKTVFRSTDNGSTWTETATGLPSGRVITDFDGAINGSGSLLYLTGETSAQVSAGFRKLFRSTDGGLNWAQCGNTGLFANASIPAAFAWLAVSPATPTVLYATVTGGDGAQAAYPRGPSVYRSADSGSTWSAVLFQDAADSRYNIANTSWVKGQWGWNQPIAGISVDPANAARVMATTITSAYLSTNSGAAWTEVHAPTGTAAAQPAGGPMIMSAWNYYIGAANPAKRYVAMTDFGGWNSSNSGATWQYSNSGNSWVNTYALAVDPANSNKAWTASAAQHDIPMWAEQQTMGTGGVGGVCATTDGGATWTPVAAEATSGLPRWGATDICIDPISAAGARRLWAAVPGKGIYFSQNDGVTWVQRNGGLDTTNLMMLRVRRASTGRLYALSTYNYSAGKSGSLYTSTDLGVTWTKIFTNPPFPTHVEIDPANDGTVYVSALYPASAAATWTGGGVWKITDYGASSAKIFNNPAYAVAVDPNNTSRLYVSCWYRGGDGLYTSANAGSTWSQIGSYPFWRALTVSFDPADANALYVTNWGGGVYKGTHQGNWP